MVKEEVKRPERRRKLIPFLSGSLKRSEENVNNYPSPQEYHPRNGVNIHICRLKKILSRKFRKISKAILALTKKGLQRTNKPILDLDHMIFMNKTMSREDHIISYRGSQDSEDATSHLFMI